MPKTSAQRQAAYRARRPFAGDRGNGQRRLNLWVDTAAELAIERMARRYCVTKATIIQHLVLKEDQRILSAMDMDTPEWDRYFNRPALRSNEHSGTSGQATFDQCKHKIREVPMD